jgi:hypothetical protein
MIGWVGPTAGLDAVGRQTFLLLQDTDAGRPSRNQVTTVLYSYSVGHLDPREN